jgi:hypothetical protein
MLGWWGDFVSPAMYAPVELADHGDGMDMFGGGGDSDDDTAQPKKKAKVEQQHQPATAAPAGGQPAAAERAASAASTPPPPVVRDATAQKEDTTDYASWPIGELRRFLTENGEDAKSCVEKADLVAKVGVETDTASNSLGSARSKGSLRATQSTAHT